MMNTQPATGACSAITSRNPANAQALVASLSSARNGRAFKTTAPGKTAQSFLSTRIQSIAKRAHMLIGFLHVHSKPDLLPKATPAGACSVPPSQPPALTDLVTPLQEGMEQLLRCNERLKGADTTPVITARAMLEGHHIILKLIGIEFTPKFAEREQSALFDRAFIPICDALNADIFATDPPTLPPDRLLQLYDTLRAELNGALAIPSSQET